MYLGKLKKKNRDIAHKRVLKGEKIENIEIRKHGYPVLNNIYMSGVRMEMKDKGKIKYHYVKYNLFFSLISHIWESYPQPVVLHLLTSAPLPHDWLQ